MSTEYREKKQPLEEKVERVLPFSREEESVMIPTPEVFINSVRKYLLKRGNKIPDLFTGIKILTSGEKSSASSSILIMGDLNLAGSDYPVIMKLGFEYMDVFDNRNTVERDIYSNVISQMINYTPHVLEYYGRFPMKSISFDDPGLIESFDREIQEINKSETAYTDRAEALVLERTDGKSFGKEIMKYTNNEISMILFQVMFTLMCFQSFNMVHNDLHEYNILVNKLPYPKAIYYNIKGKVYRLESDIVPKIFDFDFSRSYGNGVIRNFGLDAYFCEDDLCNDMNNVDDAKHLLGRLLDHLVEHTHRKPLVDIIEELINDEYSRLEDYMIAFFRPLVNKGKIIRVNYKPLYEYFIPEKQKILWGKPEFKASVLDIFEIVKEEQEEQDQEYEEKMSKARESQRNQIIFGKMSKARESQRNQIIFGKMIGYWNKECKEKFDYDPFYNMKLLEKYYAGRYEEVLKSIPESEIELYKERVSDVLTYLTYPMFYFLNDSQLSAGLTANEYTILSDVITTLGRKLNIEMPLI